MDTPLPLSAPAAPWSGARPRLLAALGAVYLIWSSTYLALRVLVQHAPPLLSAGARYVVAGLILLGVLRLRGAPWPSLRGWLHSAPVGLLLFLVGNGFVALASRSASSGAAAVACGMAPLWAVLLGRWFGHRASPREMAGVGLGLLGVLTLSASSARGTPAAALLLLLAPIGWSLGSLLGKRLDLPAGLMSAATEMICGGSAMVGVAFLMGERLPARVDAPAALAFGYLVVFGSLVAFSAYNYLLRTTRPTVAMSYAYVNPALAVVLGAVAGGEPLTLPTLLATALIVGAVLVLAPPGSG